ncbi:hypothetical protein [Streptomyces sp. GESEQ-4]|uniref:hypothetical protein n=1 Tax=Streptomyces sp. GESEQ-4 TaxID=2812655 RepID=UPI001B33140C|nr:hypothetical protein [Streptomyces sp. GESEQ-4]
MPSVADSPISSTLFSAVQLHAPPSPSLTCTDEAPSLAAGLIRRTALTAPPTAGAPAPADVLALLSSPPQRTDLTVLGGVGLPAGLPAADDRN